MRSGGRDVIHLRLHARELVDWFQAAAAAASKLGDRAGEARAYGNLGIAYDSQGNYPRAIELHEKRLALARELGDRAGEARALWNLGTSLFASGSKREGVASAEAGLALSEKLGMNWPASYRDWLERTKKNQ